MKSSDFTARGTSLRESTFEPFCVKVRCGRPGVSVTRLFTREVIL